MCDTANGKQAFFFFLEIYEGVAYVGIVGWQVLYSNSGQERVVTTWFY